MITTQQVRIILDRNQNGLDGLDHFAPGEMLSTGVYWDPPARKVVAIDSPRSADRNLVLLSDRLDIAFDELVRKMAMGGGGHTGHAVPYHLGVSRASSHS